MRKNKIMPRTPEQLKIEKSRAKSDTELIRQRSADLVFDEKTETQKIVLSEDQIDRIRHNEMNPEVKLKKQKKEKQEKLKIMWEKIKSLNLEKNQVIKVSDKQFGGKKYYFLGISGDDLVVEGVHHSTESWRGPIKDSINLAAIEAISIGNNEDISKAEKEKKEWGPFKDGSRIVWNETSPAIGGEGGENSEGHWEILDSKGKVVISTEKDKNYEDFKKISSSLKEGLTLEECWYQPVQEKKRAEEMKKFDPGL